MNSSKLRHSEASSLWHNNSVLVQMLGLSPLLAVSSTLVSGIGLGAATVLVTLTSCATASMLRVQLNHDWRLLCFLLLIAIFTSIVDQFMQFAYFPLYRSLGIYLPLICCNAAILVRIETYSRHVAVGKAISDALKTATGFFLVLVVFSATREWLSTGDLFRKSELLQPFLLNDPGVASVSTSPANASFKFPPLQAGGFILLGLMLALKNLLDYKISGRSARQQR